MSNSILKKIKMLKSCCCSGPARLLCGSYPLEIVRDGILLHPRHRGLYFYKKKKNKKKSISNIFKNLFRGIHDSKTQKMLSREPLDLLINYTKTRHKHNHKSSNKLKKKGPH